MRPRGGCLRGPPKATRVRRLVPFVALIVATLLAGCKEPAPGATTAATTGLVRPGTDVVVKEIRTYQPQDGVSGSNDLYYVVTFAFTNNLGVPLAPRIDHFVLEDEDKRRFLGVDSGNASLVGISNYTGVLKVGDSHAYTVGFRVPQNTHALLFYDATF